MELNFIKLKTQLEGEFYSNNVHRLLYSTDAWQYKELPLAGA